MSQKREQNSSWGLTGMAAVGVMAGLGYALYRAGNDETSPVKTVMDFLSSSSPGAENVSPSSRNRTPESQKGSPRTSVKQTPPSAKESVSNSRQSSKGKGGGRHSLCDVCNEALKGGQALILPCCHMYHSSCISANYTFKVLSQHISPGSYSCPSCGKAVPEEIIEMIENYEHEEE